MKRLLILILFVTYKLVAQEGEWKQYLPEYNNIQFAPSINVIRVDRFNNKWFGLNGYSNINGIAGGITKFDGVNWTQYQTNNTNLPDNNIKSIEFDLNDNIWVGMRDSGLVVIKNDTVRLVRGPFNFIEKGSVKNILADKKGNIWVLFEWVQYPDGIYKPSALMKFDGENWMNINLSSIQIPQEQINNITLDKDDNLYCGSYDKIIIFDGKDWTHLEVPGVETVSYLKFDSGGVLWIGTKGSVSASILLYDNGIWENISDIYINGEPSEIIADGFGNIWVSSIYADSGLAKFDGDYWDYFNRNNSSILWNNIRTLALDSTGVLWCGTQFGACSFRNDKWEYYSSSDGTAIKNINKVIVDYSNNKWFSAGHFGLGRYDGTTWQYYNKSNSGIPFNDIYDFAIDTEGNIWVVTFGNGLGVFNGVDWSLYNENNTGLPIDKLSKIEIDSKIKIWITTF